MLSLEYVKTHVKEIEKDDFLDKRWTKRLMDFLPYEEWKDYGFTPADDFDKDNYKPKEWTETNLLEQLKTDVDFAIYKATNHRGISASLMNDVLRAWCVVLENGLENVDYGWYGDKLIKELNTQYNLGFPLDELFNEEFYEEW